MPIPLMRFARPVVVACLALLGTAQAISAQTTGPVRVSLDEAIQMALQHNHTLLAARSTIEQSRAEEITANLRPNPTLLGDAEFLPVFQPSEFNSTFIDNSAEFDLGIQLSIRARQEAPASAAGSPGPDGRHTLAPITNAR
jgi:outer membrane protein TolC